MATFRIFAPKQGPNPVRIQRWNGTIRAGEDLKIAFTMLDADGETPLHLVDPLGTLSLYPVEPHAWSERDYGMGWLTSQCNATVAVHSFQVVDEIGRINFWLTGSQTAQLWGVFRLVLEVDDFDGANVQVEGGLQVRPGVAPADKPRIYFQPGITPIGVGIIPGRVINNIPVDADAFPLSARPYLPPSVPGGLDNGASGILGLGVLGRMILGLGGA